MLHILFLLSLFGTFSLNAANPWALTPEDLKLFKHHEFLVTQVVKKPCRSPEQIAAIAHARTLNKNGTQWHLKSSIFPTPEQITASKQSALDHLRRLTPPLTPTNQHSVTYIHWLEDQWKRQETK